MKNAPDTITSGPGSISWNINREIVVVLGWPAAILMQMAHPLVLAGVLEHSVFVREPQRRLERLRSTVESMLLLTFGTPEQVQQTADKINGIHDYVFGELDQRQGIFEAGSWYSAHDPELLRWVHATLLDVLPRAYELFVGPLTATEKDTYCAEASAMEQLLLMPGGVLPRSTRELEDYMEGMYSGGAIQVTDRARAFAAELLAMPPPIPDLGALNWLNALPTLCLLPPRLREAYGFPWGAAERAAACAGISLGRRVIRHMPPLMRHWPASRRPVD